MSYRAGVQQVFEAVGLLADNPRPAGAFTVKATGYHFQVGFHPGSVRDR